MRRRSTESAVCKAGFSSSHDNEEVLFLVKLILGVAMQSEKSSVIVSQITSLDKDTQDTLMQLLKDVLASMQPEAEPGEEYDGPLKTFDEILQEYPDMEDEEDDWHDWDADSPLHGVGGRRCPC